MDMTHLITAYFNAFERKDGETWVGMFAHDGSLGGPAQPPPVVGHAALGEMFAGIAALFESVKFNILALHCTAPSLWRSFTCTPARATAEPLPPRAWWPSRPMLPDG